MSVNPAPSMPCAVTGPYSRFSCGLLRQDQMVAQQMVAQQMVARSRPCATTGPCCCFSCVLPRHHQVVWSQSLSRYHRDQRCYYIHQTALSTRLRSLPPGAPQLHGPVNPRSAGRLDCLLLQDARCGHQIVLYCCRCQHCWCCVGAATQSSAPRPFQRCRTTPAPPL